MSQIQLPSQAHCHRRDTWIPGLEIISDGNTIRGLQVINFTGTGLVVANGKNNVIGGDRNSGAGPTGRGNMTSSNDFGIGLWDFAANNIVLGNLVGTDSSGEQALGNLSSGVWITEGGRDNVIGPDNIIAYNGRCGIGVEDSLGNTITQNSIYDNQGSGICRLGGETVLVTPLIIDFDLSSGLVSGMTCASCGVEIFSDEDDEGAIYEGWTTANDTGVFTFTGDVSFTGPNLIATTTDLKGNTSQFSLPTHGTAGSLSLQRGNDLTMTQFQPRHSKDLVDNRIGAQFDSFGYPEFYDLGIYDRGVKRVRVAIAGLEPELVDWDKPEFSIDPVHDDVFTRMADNGIIITYVLTFWDKMTYPGGEGAPCARFKTEGEIERYLEFVQFIVHHFKDRVQYFEIWNEPDIREYCPKWIESVDYINLVKRTVPVILEASPEAKIVVGGVSNLKFSGAYDYLFDLLESDIMPLVDVVAWHPMYGTSPAYDLYRDYYYQYPSIVQEIRDVASAHGFDGEYQADEIGWSTPETAISDQPWVYSPTVAAKYFGRGILMHLGMDVGVGAPDDNSVVRNLCTLMAGAEPADLQVQIQSTATNIVSYTFSTPNGDHMVALWTDGVAVDNDPGIETTLTIPDFIAGEVIGLDILYGIEQQIITDNEDGNLVIRDLLVKDYPIILLLYAGE
jgi:parallel beta-helix repeat protein